MRARDYFPLGIATGQAFCNRVDETALLAENIKHGKHTLLMATRRYGKSSLALHALKKVELPYVEVDFYMARNEKVIEAYILNGVTEAIGKALGPVDKLIASIKKYVKNLKPKINIGGAALKLELATDSETDPATNVKEALQLLERLLEENQKRAILLLDEFQNIGAIAKGTGIEAAIRHVVQKTKYLTIIFSASNRKLLKAMFEDDTRPLYKLFWKISLKRISYKHYKGHIQKIAKSVWQCELDDTAIKAICVLTERHPYYVNKLCDRLLAYHEKKPPAEKEVVTAWKIILEEEKSDAIKEISLLPAGQKNVLLQLAKRITVPISSKANMLALQMTSSSIFTALTALDEKDIIEKEDESYRIVSPIVQYYVLKNDKAAIES
jgi:AAA+ ATPase superfamily predicted ATPase